MTSAFTATPGVDVISTSVDIPTLGLLAVNAFVLHGAEPVLVDTGTGAEAGDFMATLGSVIDPKDLRWIWLTHTDFDHIGSLHTLLDANPQLRVITSFAGVGIMGVSPAPLPMDRVHRRATAHLRQPDHHGIRGRPHRHPVQLRLLRRAPHRGAGGGGRRGQR
jgi:glyoxylase-like metal-dependent hydrolase (beta-lactamase superfamily II)